MNFYRPIEREYFYCVEIIEEVLLTYEQHLEREHGEVCTSDPDDNTDYGAMHWYKHQTTSFAEKEWDKLVIRLREQFKVHAKTMIQGTDNNNNYVYHVGTVYGLKGEFLKRSKFWIQRSATVEMDAQKFAKDLTKIGKGA
ncbi:hypothetical protein [Brevibacillus reuszeri]|uniref:hypothetical protein n=1 Tax=Brevibacillus reuszeri TaxID=54915 RepID=UPI000CCC17FA|nr:hypothetical protein [Brevibacillus reuszeri]